MVGQMSDSDKETLSDAARLYWNELGGTFGRLPGRHTTINFGDDLEPVALGRYLYNQKSSGHFPNLYPEMREILREAGLGRHFEYTADGRVHLKKDTPSEANSKTLTANYGMDSRGNRYISIREGAVETYSRPYIRPGQLEERAAARARAARMRPGSGPGQSTQASPEPAEPEHLPTPVIHNSHGIRGMAMPTEEAYRSGTSHVPARPALNSPSTGRTRTPPARKGHSR
jgi:hypothetical protein